MSSSFVLPVIAAAVVGAAGSRAGTVSQLPPVPDAHGFAGAFAGVWKDRLLAGGGANFSDGYYLVGKSLIFGLFFLSEERRRDMRWYLVGSN